MQQWGLPWTIKWVSKRGRVQSSKQAPGRESATNTKVLQPASWREKPKPDWCCCDSLSWREGDPKQHWRGNRKFSDRQFHVGEGAEPCQGNPNTLLSPGLPPRLQWESCPASALYSDGVPAGYGVPVRQRLRTWAECRAAVESPAARTCRVHPGLEGDFGQISGYFDWDGVSVRMCKMRPASCSVQVCSITHSPSPKPWQGVGVCTASLPQHLAQNVRASKGHRSKLRGGKHQVENQSANSRAFLIFTCTIRNELEVLHFYLNCKCDFPEGFPSFSLVWQWGPFGKTWIWLWSKTSSEFRDLWCTRTINSLSPAFALDIIVLKGSRHQQQKVSHTLKTCDINPGSSLCVRVTAGEGHIVPFSSLGPI